MLSVPAAAAGLILGLSYPSTVWFAILEGGFIGGVTGAALGLLVGATVSLLAAVARHVKHLG